MTLAENRKKVVMATAAVAGSRLLGFPLALLVSMWLARLLSREEFAFYGVLAAFSMLFAMFAQAGFQTGVVRMLAEAEASEDRKAQPSIIYASVLTTLLCSALLGAVFYFVGRGILPRLPGETDWLFLIAAVFLVARSLNTVAAEALRGIGRVGMSANFSAQGTQGGIIRCIFMLGGLFLATSTGLVTLETAIWISIAASAICAVLALIVLLAHTGFRSNTREVLATANARRGDNFNMMISEALLYWTSASAALVIGGVFLEAAVMAGMVAAFQLRNIITSPLTMIAGAVPNILIRLHKEGHKEELETLLRSTASAAFVASLGACLVLTAIGPWGFRMLFGPEYGDAYLHFVIMAVGIVFFIYCGLSGQAMLLMGDTTVHRQVMMKVLFITMPAYVILVLVAGPYGLSIGLAFSLILQKVLMIRAVRDNLGLDTRAYLDPRQYAKAPAMFRQILASRKNEEA